MEKYIPLNALVAEIKRILSAFENSDASVDRLRASTLIGLLSFIDTLDVKEVDLEEEIKRFTMSKELYEADSVIKAVAEHFYELGLKAQKGE